MVLQNIRERLLGPFRFVEHPRHGYETLIFEMETDNMNSDLKNLAADLEKTHKEEQDYVVGEEE